MYMAFTVPPVPTGMKAGVRMVPRGMVISPRRAPPSVARRVKVNSLLMTFAFPVSFVSSLARPASDPQGLNAMAGRCHARFRVWPLLQAGRQAVTIPRV